MRWGASGRTDTFEYRRVAWCPSDSSRHLIQGEPLECFADGGTLDESIFTSLRVSGSLPFRNKPELGADLVRIIMHSTDCDGETYTKTLATMIPTCPKELISTDGTSGTLELYSLLYIASAAKIQTPLCIAANQLAIAYAKTLLESLGLRVDADDSLATLNVARCYDAMTSYLDIVNDLCGFAGFGAATVNGDGRIQLRRYQQPSGRAPAFQMVSGDGAVFGPDVTHELDIFSVPNAYTVVSSPANGTPAYYTAENHDASSPVSIESRGYRVDDGETISDAYDSAALQALAYRRLLDRTSAVEAINISHLWVPYEVGDVITVDYPETGNRWKYATCSRSMKLESGCMCEARARRFE